jgi:hypothetical protein
MYAKSVLKAMLGETVTGVIPEELITTDRIMQRWQVAGGSGLPTPKWDDSRKSKPPPLDDDSFVVVEKIFNHSPPRTHRVLDKWYRSPAPTRVIARGMGMSPRSLEKALVVCLYYVKWKIENTKHPTLLKLLRIQV